MKKAITEIGLDLAKSVFQVHGIDAKGEIVCRRAPSDRRNFCRQIQTFKAQFPTPSIREFFDQNGEFRLMNSDPVKEYSSEMHDNYESNISHAHTFTASIAPDPKTRGPCQVVKRLPSHD